MSPGGRLWYGQRSCERSVLALAAASALTAAPINLVVNGEFEVPLITDNGGDFQRFDDPLFVPGWTDDDPDVGIELWRQSFLASPALGTDGDPTGQHMELIARNPGTIISQTFLVPVFVGTDAIFQFDAWQRGATGSGSGTNSGVYSIVGSVLGTLVNQAVIIMSETAWVLNQQLLTIVPGETITISFTGFGASDRSPHVDQVEFIVDGVVPEPGAVALLGGGLLGLLLLRRRSPRS